MVGYERWDQMSRVIWKLSLKAGIHQFPPGVFGSTSDLIHPLEVRERDTLIIACSEQGAAPDNISFAEPERFIVLQHLAASMPSQAETERYEGLSCRDVERLFDKYDFRHVILCGHLGCRVISSWLQPVRKGYADIGNFRLRFEKGTRDFVDKNYSPYTITERRMLMICEHVLRQIENLLTHPFIMERIQTKKTSFHGWVVDDDSARVLGYHPEESAFIPI